MTENEIRIINGKEIVLYREIETDLYRFSKDAVDMLFQTFEEAEQYREIGTVEEFKALKEKSMAKKPILSTEIVNQLADEYNNDFCEWKQHEREIYVYFTQCGQAHIFVDGNPEENNHVFCPYCGKKIKVAHYQSKGE